MKKKSLLIIYTGGTIGMDKTPQGYQPKPGLLPDILRNTPSFQHKDIPHYDILEYSPLLDSAMITPMHWGQIANDIEKHYQQYDGFIILHGTDTMAYSASALSFMLENLAKPVILTGSQVALVDAHSDARENLIGAMLLAAKFTIPEVCVFFNNQLFRGNRCQKLNADSFNAFASPNYPLLGEVGFNSIVYPDNLLTMPQQPLSTTHIDKNIKLCHVTLFPGFQANLLNSFIENGIQGITLRTYGSGNAPIDNPQLMTFLKQAQQQGVIIINCTQCKTGRVDMATYATGQKLLEYGVLSGYDLTVEAAITKLYYVFSKYHTPTDIKHQLSHSLAGEMTCS